jgi:hypothetical protein
VDRHGPNASDRPRSRQVVELAAVDRDFELVIKAQSHIDVDLADKRVTLNCSGATDPADPYADFDALILPRRYSGLCLPMNDALMSGLPVIMTDCAPNDLLLPSSWLVPAKVTGQFMARTMIDLYEADARELSVRWGGHRNRGTGMADRAVTQVRKRNDGRPIGLCNPNESWSPRRAADVIADIESGTHRYFVDANGSQTSIAVVNGRLGKYLRSGPDVTTGNNLSELPDCTTQGNPDGVDTLVRARRNIATVSQAERDRLRDAIVALDSRFYPNDSVSWWKKQDQIHQATHVHAGPAFLPWHRELTNRFEALLQEVDPEVTLHYWDWQTDPRHSADHGGGLVDLFTPGFMGMPEGAAGPPFGYLKITRQVAPGTPRDYDYVDQVGDHHHIGADEDPIWPDDFPTMREKMEGVHDLVHAYIGGTIGRAHSAFEDPFVFLLHSNVDRLFASWQLRARGDSRLALPRLNPDEVYGDEHDSTVIKEVLQPWGGGTDVEPWKTHPEIKTSLDPSIVRPPIYDTYVFPLGCSWNAMAPGSSHKLPDGDIIEATVTLDAVDRSVVEFVLETGPRVDFWKGLRVPDGEGNSWLIEAERGKDFEDRVSLWADQVHNGQELIFHKAKFLGSHRVVYRLGGIGDIAPGSRVTFRWLRDSEI